VQWKENEKGDIGSWGKTRATFGEIKKSNFNFGDLL